MDSGSFNGQPYNDVVSNIFGLSTGSAMVAPINISDGSTNTHVISANSATITANANNAQNSAGGNSTVTFGSTPITQFSFTYTDNAAANSAHSTLQIIALSDLTFTTVPEPSAWAFFAAAGGVGIWTLRRRTRRQL